MAEREGRGTAALLDDKHSARWVPWDEVQSRLDALDAEQEESR